MFVSYGTVNTANVLYYLSSLLLTSVSLWAQQTHYFAVSGWAPAMPRLLLCAGFETVDASME